mmetsp:Transcript_39424/g.67188  ORF Transcript_39424/g.67188 Transcript_39424/m.67188 type:complete len:157 (-) Transcript_39424:671-1141(-)
MSKEGKNRNSQPGRLEPVLPKPNHRLDPKNCNPSQINRNPSQITFQQCPVPLQNKSPPIVSQHSDGNDGTASDDDGSIASRDNESIVHFINCSGDEGITDEDGNEESILLGWSWQLHPHEVISIIDSWHKNLEEGEDNLSRRAFCKKHSTTMTRTI